MDDAFSAPSFSIHKITEGLWRFNECMGDMAAVDAYLVLGSARAALIDTLQSDMPSNLADTVREITHLPVDVLITHGHPDHAGAETRKLAGAEGFTLHMSHDARFSARQPDGASDEGRQNRAA